DRFDNYAIQVSFLIVSAIVLAVLRLDPKFGWLRSMGGRSTYGIEIVAMMICGYLAYQVGQSTEGHKLMIRNFYGGLKITDTGPATAFDSVRRLTHGTINHGEQYLNPALRDRP